MIPTFQHFARAFIAQVVERSTRSYEDFARDLQPVSRSPTMDIQITAGGVMGGRPLNAADPFERAVAAAFGEIIRAGDQARSAEVWAALTGAIWVSPDGQRQGYTYRAAGDIVAAIQGEGDYMRWYCSAEIPATPPAWIAEAMASQGWTWERSERP